MTTSYIKVVPDIFLPMIFTLSNNSHLEGKVSMHFSEGHDFE